eukprot:m.232434 g.232434  ORF g.232434 m.232434 type:complete len:207 (+) comp40080_c1_seq2:414-1034(+)
MEWIFPLATWTTPSNRQAAIPIAAVNTTCKVALADDVIVPKNCSEIIVMAELLDKNKRRVLGLRNALFEPSQQLVEKTGILPARALVDGSSGLVPVRLLRVSGSCKLYKGKTLGTLEDIPISQPVTVIQPTSQERQDAFAQADLTDLFGPHDHLTAAQQEELGQFLRSFSDVFSTGPHDLGRTSVSRHSIPTVRYRVTHVSERMCI